MLGLVERAPGPLRERLGHGLLAGYRRFLAYRGDDGMSVGPPGDLPIPPHGSGS
jgi:hypothetical protein